jgi:hypothetical protein
VDVLHAGADVGLKAADRIEVVLERQDRREGPEASEILAVERTATLGIESGEAAEKLRSDVLGEEVRQSLSRYPFGADTSVGAGNVDVRARIRRDERALHADQRVTAVVTGICRSHVQR